MIIGMWIASMFFIQGCVHPLNPEREKYAEYKVQKVFGACVIAVAWPILLIFGVLSLFSDEG